MNIKDTTRCLADFFCVLRQYTNSIYLPTFCIYFLLLLTIFPQFSSFSFSLFFSSPFHMFSHYWQQLIFSPYPGGGGGYYPIYKPLASQVTLKLLTNCLQIASWVMDEWTGLASSLSSSTLATVRRWTTVRLFPSLWVRKSFFPDPDFERDRRAKCFDLGKPTVHA